MMKFTMVPEVWIERLQGANNATFRLAIALLRLNFKHNSHAFRPTNPALKDMGVAVRSKWRGLRELEALGLVRVEKRGFKSPTIKVLHASGRLFGREAREGGRRERSERKDI